MSILKVSIYQVKAARALLGWSQDQLATASGVSLPTIKRLEAADGILGGRLDTVGRLVGGLEEAGIVFIEESMEGGIGVRLRNRSTLADTAAPLAPNSMPDADRGPATSAKSR